MCTQPQFAAIDRNKPTLHRAVGNHILLDYYTASAPSIFTSFIADVFAFCGETITQRLKLVTSPKDPTPQWRRNHWEGLVRGTVPVTFLPPVFTRKSSCRNALCSQSISWEYCNLELGSFFLTWYGSFVVDSVDSSVGAWPLIIFLHTFHLCSS